MTNLRSDLAAPLAARSNAVALQCHGFGAVDRGTGPYPTRSSYSNPVDIGFESGRVGWPGRVGLRVRVGWVLSSSSSTRLSRAIPGPLTPEPAGRCGAVGMPGPSGAWRGVKGHQIVSFHALFSRRAARVRTKLSISPAHRTPPDRRATVEVGRCASTPAWESHASRNVNPRDPPQGAARVEVGRRRDGLLA